MVHGGQEILIKDAVVFLVAAGLVVPLLRAIKVPGVIGFILAGLALGPHGLGALTERWPDLSMFAISEPAAAAPFAELGVLFLLFLLGLELTFQKLWSLRRIVFGAGAVQAGLSALFIGLALYALGLSSAAAALTGLALGLSSTAIVMQMLVEQHRAASPVGRNALGVLLFQDILVAPILILTGFLAASATGDNQQDLLATIWGALWRGGLAIAVLLLIGRYLFRPGFRLAAQSGGRDFLMALTLLVVVGSAVITATAGLSLALGAFLAGLLLGETEFKHQTEVDLEPFKGLLLGLFFMTVGMGLDLSVVFDRWHVILAGLVGLLLIKTSVAAFACRLFDKQTTSAFETAGLLAPAGEFAFVILAAGTAGGVVPMDVATIATAIAGLSMMLTPLMWKMSSALGKKLDPPKDSDEEHATADYADWKGHVVIAGFGRVGQAVAHVLRTEETNFIALDRNASRVSPLRKDGWPVYVGDGSRPEILERAGVEGASLIVVTLDDPIAALRMVEAVRKLRPAAPILSRARDAEHARILYRAGASFVVPDAIEAGLQMAARALEEIGYDNETVRARLAKLRDEEYRIAMTVAQAST